MRRKRRAAAPTDMLADYSGLSEIGSGPFATVYGAVEKAQGRPVALKVFQSAAEVSEILVREFADLAGIDHPHLVVPLRLGSTAGGLPVVASDLCGDSLARVIDRRGAMSPHDVAGAGVKAAGALAVLHDAGVLHQNLKPQNVLVTLMGEPALSDPGQVSFQMSVRSIASGARFTAFHCPPEMFEAGELSPATDVYGLASTMYQLLCGRAPFQPFDGEPAISVVLRILRDQVDPLPSDVPFPLVHLLESALAKDPDRRPRTALAFGEELREVAAGQGWTVAVPPSRQAGSAAGTPQETATDDRQPDASTRRFRRRNRRGITAPPDTDRNVILPEGTRHGSMDRPPRKS